MTLELRHLLSELHDTSPAWTAAFPVPVQHGNSAYQSGCRCDVCRDAHRDEQRERRARRMA